LPDQGDPVVLLHGFGETSPHVVAADRFSDKHTVIAPDLRGLVHSIIC
jgi:pimeloyl-ACP methyl ester carboxylesterase